MTQDACVSIALGDYTGPWGETVSASIEFNNINPALYGAGYRGEAKLRLIGVRHDVVQFDKSYDSMSEDWQALYHEQGDVVKPFYQALLVAQREAFFARIEHARYGTLYLSLHADAYANLIEVDGSSPISTPRPITRDEVDVLLQLNAAIAISKKHTGDSIGRQAIDQEINQRVGLQLAQYDDIRATLLAAADPSQVFSPSFNVG